MGYPEATKYFSKGQTLPDGTKAEAPGHWVEGYLLRTEKADEIWSLGKALQETKRRLGFSVEGKILQRTGPANRIIAKALVRNVAITNCPVNTDSRMEILAKCLRSTAKAELAEDDEDDAEKCEKTLGMGAPPAGNANPSTMGPTSGMGAGQIITPTSLESPTRKMGGGRGGKRRRKRIHKALGTREAFAYLQKRLPQASAEQIARIIAATHRAKRSNS